MNTENKTLVICTPGFPASEADTTCLPMQQHFVRSLKDLYPGLKIIALSFQYPYHTKKYNWFGIEVIPFSGINKGGLQQLLRQKKILSTLKEIHQSNKIIGLLSFWYGECALAGKIFSAKNNLPHFCWILGQDAKKENNYSWRIRATGSELIALSDFLQGEFEKNHGCKPQYVIPPGIDDRQCGHPVKEKDIDIIAAGSLIPLKQYTIFVDVITALKKQIPGIKARLIGNGPESNKLQALISEKGLRSNIILDGELPHPEVLQHMQSAKIFLHPSSYEGFGVVCIEALHAGCQVISFCKPMNREIEQWHIVKNTAEMTGKVLELLENPCTVFKQVTPFKMDDIVKQMMALFLC